MNPIKSLKQVRHEVGIPQHISITHFNSPTVLETQSGALFSVIQLQGVPFATEKNETINHLHRQWHRALTFLDERFALLGTLHRRKVHCQLTGKFNNSFTKHIDAVYQKQFVQQPLYVNDLYLTLILKGLATQKIGRISTWLSALSRHTMKKARQSMRQGQSKVLQEVVMQFMTLLTPFAPRILGEQDLSSDFSELLAYLSLWVNGCQALALRKSQTVPPLAKSFIETRQAQLRYPRGNLAHYLSAQRLFFGQAIQFQGSLAEQTRFAAMVSLKRYGSETASVMLDPLLHLNSEFISTQSFLFESKVQADKTIERHARKLQNANDPAYRQIEALTEARDQVASDEMAMGYHHNTVMLLSDSLPGLNQAIAQIIQCYANAGIVAVRETLGQEAAFWAQIPGNFKYIACSSLISSKNFADFFPLRNYRSGYQDANHLGGAMMLVEMLSRTPLWLNLHAKGPQENPSSGHTTIIGGNGSGKTVMMCCFDAQLNRYGGRSFFFDRNRGAEIYIRASGGLYSILAPDYAEEIQMNPLQLPDSPSHRQFCKKWMIQLVKKEGEQEVAEEIAEPLRQCVDYGYDHLAAPYRHLSQVTQRLPLHFPRWAALRRWLHGAADRPFGEYAYLFDNPKDALTLPLKMGFDMTHFLDNEPALILTAVMHYLFYRIELTLQESKHLVSIFLDEAWQYLDNLYWQNKLRKWLPTLRKLNCHLIFATQSPRSVAELPISHILLDNCATQIYFANPQAKAIHYRDGFNLTETEFHCIKNNEVQSHLFLYKQGHESSLARLNLTHLKDFLKVMSGTQQSVTLVSDLRRQVGENPEAWLPLFLKQVS